MYEPVGSKASLFYLQPLFCSLNLLFSDDRCHCRRDFFKLPTADSTQRILKDFETRKLGGKRAIISFVLCQFLFTLFSFPRFHIVLCRLQSFVRNLKKSEYKERSSFKGFFFTFPPESN